MNGGRNYNGPKVAKFLVGWSVRHLPECAAMRSTKESVVIRKQFHQIFYLSSNRQVQSSKKRNETRMINVPITRLRSSELRRGYHSVQRRYMLEPPAHPLCRKVRGGDNQQERPGFVFGLCRGILRDFTRRSGFALRGFAAMMIKSDPCGDAGGSGIELSVKTLVNMKLEMWNMKFYFTFHFYISYSGMCAPILSEFSP